MSREQVLRDYIAAWLDKDSSRLSDCFTEDIYYRESYGPRYQGLGQIQQWFADWNQQGRVTKWEIDRVFSCGDSLIASWTFACHYQGQDHAFDGVTIADFDGEKIAHLSEYSSQLEPIFPYGAEIQRKI